MTFSLLTFLYISFIGSAAVAVTMGTAGGVKSGPFPEKKADDDVINCLLEFTEQEEEVIVSVGLSGIGVFSVFNISLTDSI